MRFAALAGAGCLLLATTVSKRSAKIARAVGLCTTHRCRFIGRSTFEKISIACVSACHSSKKMSS